MGYIIVDLEFNGMRDITKYDSDFYKKHPELEASELENEIIEIGAVKVDKYMQVVSTMKEYIKPVLYPIINPIVNKITKIDMEMLNSKGILFKDGMNKLKEMFEDGDILCSWAKDDIVELIVNANYFGYEDLEWIKHYLDLQEYATKILAYKKPLGLKSALDDLKVKVDEESLHDAFYDAECTKEVFKRIYNSRGIKNYIVEDIYNMPALEIEELDKVEIKEEELKLYCPKCKKRIEIETPIKAVKWRFICVGTCPKCKKPVQCEIVPKKTLRNDIIYIENNNIISNEIYVNQCYKLSNK